MTFEEWCAEQGLHEFHPDMEPLLRQIYEGREERARVKSIPEREVNWPWLYGRRGD